MTHNRLDPSDIAPEALHELSEVLAQPGHIALTDSEGHRAELPAPLFLHFVRIVRLLAEKRSVTLVPEDEEFTTQAAANYLGVSRQHLVNLLESGKINFHKVGTHRRVKFSDLRAYANQRDESRKVALDELMEAVEEADLYDASYTGDED